MGRTEKSQGLAPPAIRKDIRAKQARHIVNKVVPLILASNTRARKGANGSELIVDPGPVTTHSEKGTKEKDVTADDDTKYIKRKGQGRRKAKIISEDAEPEDSKPITKGHRMKESNSAPLPNISLEDRPPIKLRVMTTDTLTAAQTLTTKARNQPNPCILNMASPLRPGGGVLAGATSQEEYLCARTTLLPSLADSFYRLPELGGVFTRDVLVFRNYLPLGDTKGELPPTERWYVDVVSAGMLRFPDLEGEEDEKRLSKKDRRLVEAKMRGVLRIACSRGVKKIVLGAWGCGAYGNPVRDIAEAWRAVLIPPASPPSSQSDARNHKSKLMLETWHGLQDVVFAISNGKMADEFARAFGGIEVEAGPESREDDEDDGTGEVAEELRAKIVEMEGQVEKVWNADLKHRMGIILEGLRTQLSEREGRQGSDEAGEGEGLREEAGLSDEDASWAGLSVNGDEEEEEVVHSSSDEWQVSPFD
ncbi:uncharacterized protein N0V89_003493 [Didymosphaeria variabile]|uniref:Microbial-type PARG catalytic domain-containing protein n=1 Tax=Didymosphaeria variabile TaxID=1932322 RepID=A0A9W8XNM0_9PLEO|nr:uncharacterized protein N0V89_003493 [Didymosphaeria variabile]KAJ4355477.1 hypothetical protein N0V89_003493 [Didymosphaeria variabile]